MDSRGPQGKGYVQGKEPPTGVHAGVHALGHSCARKHLCMHEQTEIQSEDGVRGLCLHDRDAGGASWTGSAVGACVEQGRRVGVRAFDHRCRTAPCTLHWEVPGRGETPGPLSACGPARLLLTPNLHHPIAPFKGFPIPITYPPHSLTQKALQSAEVEHPPEGNLLARSPKYLQPDR